MPFIRTLTQSFYSVEMYRALRSKKGYGLGYSFMLLLVMAFFYSLVALPKLADFHNEVITGKDGKISVMDDLLGQIAAQTPEMVFQNDQLHTQAPGPHVIHLKTSVMGEALEGDAITIDTSGSASYANMKTPVLITSKELIFKQEEKTEIKPFSKVGTNKELSPQPIVINKEFARGMAQQISLYVRTHASQFYLVAGLIVAVAMIPALYIGRVVTVMLVALGGIIISRLQRQPLPFDASMRLAAVSLTPIIIMNFLVFVVGGHQVGGVLLLVLAWVVLACIIHATRAPTTEV